MINPESKRAWIALNMTLSPRQALLLLAHFPSSEAAWGASSQTLRDTPGFERDTDAFIERRQVVELDRELEEIKRRGLHVLTLEDPAYPASLRELKYPPPVLYRYGDYQQRDQLALAVVGTRRMSPYGRRVAEKLTQALVEHGLTIISGLALGVDTVAHQSALAAGGRTIAVLGSGFASLYPQENRNLAQRITKSGAIFSEFPIHTEPARWTFPRRNRIISGLSKGVLVVEAPIKSGALITAKAALDQGREVFAVPGQITHPNASGCHYLLKNGAKLVERVEDVLEEFGDLKTVMNRRDQPAPVELPPLNEPQSRVLQTLSFEPLHINAIIEKAGLSVSEVSARLLELEMLGLVNEVDGKHYVKLV